MFSPLQESRNPQMFTQEELASFNQLETSLYNYIAVNMDKVAYMRIRERAHATPLSTTAILRFCRKVGCEGSCEVNVRIKMQLEEEKTLGPQNVQHTVAEFFERTLKGDIDEKIKHAAALVERADNVIFIGIGSSGILA